MGEEEEEEVEKREEEQQEEKTRGERERAGRGGKRGMGDQKRVGHGRKEVEGTGKELAYTVINRPAASRRIHYGQAVAPSIISEGETKKNPPPSPPPWNTPP